MSKIQQGFADLGHIKLHYAESGPENDELVIFLHGFPEFWYTWRKQLPIVGDKYHAVAPDLRGYNLSDKPENVEDYRIDQLIKDVLVLAKYFGKQRFYLVSHDWGAAVAWSVALAFPEKVKGLMVLNGPHPYIFAKLLEENEEQIKHSKYMSDFRQEGLEDKLIANNCEWLWNWTFKSHFDRGLLTEEDKEAYLTAWTQPDAIKSALNLYRASPLMPRSKNAGKKSLGLKPEDFIVKVPTLVIWGEKDHALVPENIEGLDEFVPDLEIVRLPEVTHWVTHEEPERVSTEIIRFLSKLESA
ncbi:MAG: alpha/beta hydrolase [Sneathiella sp.]